MLHSLQVLEKAPEPAVANAATATATAPPPPPPPPPPPAPVNKRADGRIVATPYAKKLAKDLGIDLATIGGSGPNGRITASDVEALKNGGEQPAASVHFMWGLSSLAWSQSSIASEPCFQILV